MFIGLHAGQSIGRLVLDPFSKLYIKILPEEAKALSSEAASALFVGKELLQLLIVGNNCELL